MHEAAGTLSTWSRHSLDILRATDVYSHEFVYTNPLGCGDKNPVLLVAPIPFRERYALINNGIGKTPEIGVAPRIGYADTIRRIHWHPRVTIGGTDVDGCSTVHRDLQAVIRRRGERPSHRGSKLVDRPLSESKVSSNQQVFQGVTVTRLPLPLKAPGSTVVIVVAGEVYVFFSSRRQYHRSGGANTKRSSAAT
ncbi:hypothetical protein AB1N83_004514 [Pleurotus pulmonarius]